MSSPTHLNLGIGWQLHDRTGWGIYGINLALQLEARPDCSPVPLLPLGYLPEHPLLRQKLKPVLKRCQQMERLAQLQPSSSLPVDNLIILQGLGNNFAAAKLAWRSPRQIGVIFFENTLFNEHGRQLATTYPLIVTGSHWNEKILKNLDLPGRITTVIQGIDPTIFHPAPRAGLFKDRFVIFSGGKLEYRKAQDIVIAAFRAFRQRHPEALLLAAWHNAWPESMQEIAAAGHVRGTPTADGDLVENIGRWLVANDLPPESFLVLPETPNVYMASIIREADVAIFPNRGEGGTNLVAMEALACGVPTILAANTGQRDFADAEICFPLQRQGEVQPTPMMPGVEEWGESDPEEIVAILEEIYNHPERARERGRQGARHLQNFTWEKQVGKLVTTIREFFGIQE